MLVVSALLWAPVGIAASDGPERVDALVLNPGEDYLVAGTTDGTFGYFGTVTSPGRIVKVRLSDMTRVAAITLGTFDGSVVSAVTDGTYGYFGLFTQPGRIVKVRLSDFRIFGSPLGLAHGEDSLYSAVIDPAGEYAYFGTGTSPARVVKVRLADMTRQGAVTLTEDGKNLRSAIIDADGSHAYFGTDNTAPTRGRVVKVRLSDMTRVGAAILEPGEERLFAGVREGTTGYFTTVSNPGRIVEVDLATMTRTRSLTLDVDRPVSIISDGTYAYLGTETYPASVVQVRLSDLSSVGRITLESGEEAIFSAITDGTHAYFGTETRPGRVVKVRLPGGGTVASSEPVTAALPAVTCLPDLRVAGTTVQCTVNSGDPGIEILWRAVVGEDVVGSTGVRIGADGSGDFSFVIPGNAAGRPLSVELVDWTHPFDLGAVSGPVPTSVPSGQGQVPAWPLLLGVVLSAFALRYGARPGRERTRQG